MASEFSIREIYVGLFSTFLLHSIVHLTWQNWLLTLLGLCENPVPVVRWMHFPHSFTWTENCYSINNFLKGMTIVPSDTTYLIWLLFKINCSVTLHSQKETEVKERSVFDIPIFTEEFLNHSKGDYWSLFCVHQIWGRVSGGIHCSKAVVMIFRTLGLIWKKKTASISLPSSNGSWFLKTEGKLGQCC